MGFNNNELNERDLSKTDSPRWLIRRVVRCLELFLWLYTFADGDRINKSIICNRRQTEDSTSDHQDELSFR